MQPGDLVIERIALSGVGGDFTNLGIVIGVTLVNHDNYYMSEANYAYTLSKNREHISYVLFPGQGIKGPYLPGQLVKHPPAA